MRVPYILAALFYTGAVLSMAGAAQAAGSDSAVSEAAAILSTKPDGDALLHAIDLLKGAADEGSVAALRKLGEIYSTGKYGDVADPPAAIAFYERAIELRDNGSRKALAKMLIAGEGVAADPQRAVNLLQAAVDNGDDGAANTLALIYIKGVDGIAPNGDKARLLLEPLAESGRVASIVALGNLYRKGSIGLPADPAKAASYYSRAIELGSNEARSALASLYRDGRGVEQDVARAIALFTEAAEKGDASAYGALGRLYAQGLGGTTADGAKALAAYEAAIAAGYTKARVALATLLSDGKAVTADPAKAATLLEAELADGDYGVAVKLAQIYATGGDGLAINGERAVELLQPIADAGNSGALTLLGNIYVLGTGTVPSDTDKAFAYYARARELGEETAAEEIAKLLANGPVTSANFEAVVALLERLGKSGDAGAYLTLGDIFSEGEIATPNVDRARSYYEFAARAGDPAGIVRMARLLSSGAPGVAQDEAAAVTYYIQAIEAGDNGARRSLADLLLAAEVIPRDVPRAIALLNEAMAAGDATAALTLGRIYSQGGSVPASYEDTKAAFEQATVLGKKAGLLHLARALTGPIFGPKHANEGRQLLLAAVEQEIPGARAALARLQATGKFPGAGPVDAIKTLERGVELGDVSSIRYLVQIYRDGIKKSIKANPKKALTLLDHVSSALPHSVGAAERAMLSVRTSPSLGTFAMVSRELGKLEPGDAQALIRRLRTLNANSYVYVVQDYLKLRGYYEGPLNGLLTTSTIRAFNAACAKGNASAACEKGPLSMNAAKFISSLMLQTDDVPTNATNEDSTAHLPVQPIAFMPSVRQTGDWSHVTAI